MNKNIYKTGNKKCWTVIDTVSGREYGGVGGWTLRTAKSEAARMDREANETCHHTPLLNGYHFVPCTGEAHGNPHIDSCGLCAPNWGTVMVPERFKTLAEYWESL